MAICSGKRKLPRGMTIFETPPAPQALQLLRLVRLRPSQAPRIAEPAQQQPLAPTELDNVDSVLKNGHRLDNC